MLYCRGAVGGGVSLMTSLLYGILHESDIIFTYISYKIVFISMFIGIILLSGIKYHEYFSRDTYR